MPSRRRLLLAAATLACIIFVLILRRGSIEQTLGGDLQIPGASSWLSNVNIGSALPKLSHGGVTHSDKNYTRLLVVPTMKGNDISWLDQELPTLDKITYVADDRTAPYHPPKNKGNEVMIYLTYIIDHYDALPDITIFLHAHRHAWHNNDLLDNDAAQMLQRLSNARVMREGYMNLRCQWDPGCPHWLHPKSDDFHLKKQEQIFIAKAWGELFPFELMPTALSAPCCAQFAVSRDAIRALPISRYVWFRDWIMRTELSNYMAGRVFEYIWQYIFTGVHEVCPSQHVCYCDGYGVCFAGERAFQRWFEMRWRMNEKKKDLDKWREMNVEYEEAKNNGTLESMKEADRPQQPEAVRDDVLQREIESMRIEMADMKEVALRRGLDPKIRAQESGRKWEEGDGF
ncbi:hypothetical protein NA57DRAFT_79331 [Rhizodiscina lignyota]|uniref:Uncharacterized protein n=1 Tax=Rhizodiscina lignyota TaxID=1504668 RepID=A0A9P4I8V6_9PEZI|nr:hypothetical protein NA57DRAFT_79331 [Rhizodiscina lignyota]